MKLLNKNLKLNAVSRRLTVKERISNAAIRVLFKNGFVKTKKGYISAGKAISQAILDGDKKVALYHVFLFLSQEDKERIAETCRCAIIDKAAEGAPDYFEAKRKAEDKVNSAKGNGVKWNIVVCEDEEETDERLGGRTIVRPKIGSKAINKLILDNEIDMFDLDNIYQFLSLSRIFNRSGGEGTIDASKHNLIPDTGWSLMIQDLGRSRASFNEHGELEIDDEIYGDNVGFVSFSRMMTDAMVAKINDKENPFIEFPVLNETSASDADISVIYDRYEEVMFNICLTEKDMNNACAVIEALSDRDAYDIKNDKDKFFENLEGINKAKNEVIDAARSAILGYLRDIGKTDEDFVSFIMYNSQFFKLDKEEERLITTASCSTSMAKLVEPFEVRNVTGTNDFEVTLKVSGNKDKMKALKNLAKEKGKVTFLARNGFCARHDVSVSNGYTGLVKYDGKTATGKVYIDYAFDVPDEKTIIIGEHIETGSLNENRVWNNEDKDIVEILADGARESLEEAYDLGDIIGYELVSGAKKGEEFVILDKRFVAVNLIELTIEKL